MDPMATTTQVVTCVCGQKNRVPAIRAGQRVRCGKCKAALLVRGQDDPRWTPTDFSLPYEHGSPMAPAAPIDDDDEEDDEDDDDENDY